MKKNEYEKPVLRTIELKAEEVLSTGCKVDDSGLGPGGGCGYITHCAGFGT